MANDGQNIVKRIQYIAYMETYQRYLTGQCYLMGSLKPTLLDYLQSDLNDRLHFINQRSFHKSPSSTLANTVKVFNQNDLDKSRDNKDSRRIIIVQKPKSRPKIEPGTLTFNLWDQIAHIDLTGVFNLSSVGLRRGFKTSNMASTKEFNKKRIINQIRHNRKYQKNLRKISKKYPEVMSESTSASKSDSSKEVTTGGGMSSENRALIDDPWVCGTPLPRDSFDSSQEWAKVVEILNEKTKTLLERTLHELGDDGRHQLASPREYLNWACYARDRVLDYFRSLENDDCVLNFLPELELKYDRRFEICSMIGYTHLIICGPKKPKDTWMERIKRDIPFIICEKVKKVRAYYGKKRNRNITDVVPSEVINFYQKRPVEENANTLSEDLRDSTYSSFFFASLVRNGIENPILSDNCSKKPTLSKTELMKHKKTNHAANLLKREDLNSKQLEYLDDDSNLPTLSTLSKMYIPKEKYDTVYLNKSLVRVPRAYKDFKKGKTEDEFYSEMVSCYRIRILYSAVPCHWIDFERFGASHKDKDKYAKIISLRKFPERALERNEDSQSGEKANQMIPFNGDFKPKKVEELLRLTKLQSDRNNLNSSLKVKIRKKKNNKVEETTKNIKGFAKEAGHEDIKSLYANAERIKKEEILKKEMLAAKIQEEKDKSRKRKRQENESKKVKKSNQKKPQRKRTKFSSVCVGNRNIVDMFSLKRTGTQ